MGVNIINAGSVPGQSTAGSQYSLVVNSDGSLNIGSVSQSLTQIGSIWQMGLSNFEVIRNNSGSPAINYVFSNIANSFLIHNLGSSPVYYNINASANPANSGTAILGGSEAISFNFRAGSISIQGSGITSPPVQVIRIS